MPQTNGKNDYRAVPANFWAQKISVFLRRFLLLVSASGFEPETL